MVGPPAEIDLLLDAPVADDQHTICVGRGAGVMGHQDGVDTVVRAADLIVHEWGRRDVGFVLMGFGDCFDELVRLTSELDLDFKTLVAFSVAFLGTAAMWWLYFNLAARMAALRLAKAGAASTTMARDAYTYMHVLLAAGEPVRVPVAREQLEARPVDVLRQVPAGVDRHHGIPLVVHDQRGVGGHSA